MKQGKPSHRNNAPIGYPELPVMLFDRFRVPRAPVLKVSDQLAPGAEREIHEAPLAGTDGLTLVLRKDILHGRLVSGALMVMPNPPIPEFFLIPETKLPLRALLSVEVNDEEVPSLWARGRGFWRRHIVRSLRGKAAQRLGLIPHAWRLRLHEIEMFADKLVRQSAGKHQGFWEREFNPGGRYQKRPERAR